jgi:hypothetical protein
MNKAKSPPSLNYQDLVKPYSDDELKMTPEIEAKLNKLLKFFAETGINYQDIEKSHKKAYPNYDEHMYTPAPYNLTKWLDTARELFQQEQNGINRVVAIRQATKEWKITETFDFLNWLKYYQGGNHMKYKMSEAQPTMTKSAQLWYENGPGFFLPIKPDVKEEPKVSGEDIDFAKETAHNNHEKRQTIEKQRNKIIGRLDSAEKLLRSTDGQTFAGKELEALMEAIYQLKKKIQLVNKVSVSTKLYEDMIVRQANSLQRDGFFKAAERLFSVAQANSKTELGGTKGIESLPPAVPQDPSGAGHPGTPGTLPSMGPGMPQDAPFTTAVQGPNDNSPTNLKGVDGKPQPTAAAGIAPPMPAETKPKGISEFLENMDTGKITSNDDLEVSDADDLFISEAQLSPVPPEEVSMTDRPAPSKLNPAKLTAPKTLPDAPDVEQPLEVSEDDIKAPVSQGATPAEIGAFDQKINSAFSNVTIADVVTKLDGITNVFRTRELARQLSLIDLMLDSLNISSLFPTLSEAINKNLDANQYCLTRLEDILSRLKGAIPSQNIELNGNDETRPEVAGIKNKLQQDADKEKARKEQRKNKENEEMEGANPAKETPAVDIKEDLAPPPVKTPAPVIPPKA